MRLWAIVLAVLLAILPCAPARAADAEDVELRARVDRIIADLDKRQIASRAYFEPIHLQPLYQSRFGFRKGDFPITERIAASTLALPFHANLRSSDIEAVADALQSAICLAAA